MPETTKTIAELAQEELDKGLQQRKVSIMQTLLIKKKRHEASLQTLEALAELIETTQDTDKITEIENNVWKDPMSGLSLGSVSSGSVFVSRSLSAG